MITEKEFNRAISRFGELEKRGSFYDMAVNLLNNNFEIEAYLLILATWNFANFRYVVKDFNISEFEERIRRLDPHFNRLRNKDLRTINFDEYKEDIGEIYETLASIEGVKYTGASKIMHLKNRFVFIMWDGYIKGHHSSKYYKELKICKEGDWKLRHYGNDAKSYLQFLKDMQESFKDVTFQSDRKTFTKAIDEFNYVNITLPIQEMESKVKS
jgi:hypothetical protein